MVSAGLIRKKCIVAIFFNVLSLMAISCPVFNRVWLAIVRVGLGRRMTGLGYHKGCEMEALETGRG